MEIEMEINASMGKQGINIVYRSQKVSFEEKQVPLLWSIFTSNSTESPRFVDLEKSNQFGGKKKYYTIRNT